MHVPGPYRQPDSSWLVDLIRRNPLALLVTNGDVEPYATHLPIIAAPLPAAEWPPELAGSTLVGHMNRVNQHWRSLRAAMPAVLVFTGPNGYVSPQVYGYEPAAPTWNYTAVHVHGTVEPIESRDEALEVVRATARTFEQDFGAGWSQSGSIDYFRRILPGVGAFRFLVSHAEGMFKLSQEQRPEVRSQVRESFAGSDRCQHRAAAELMARWSEQHEDR